MNHERQDSLLERAQGHNKHAKGAKNAFVSRRKEVWFTTSGGGFMDQVDNLEGRRSIMF